MARNKLIEISINKCDKITDEISLKHLPIKRTLVHLKNIVFPAKRHYQPNKKSHNKEREISDSVQMYDRNGNAFTMSIIDTIKMPEPELSSKLNDHLVNIYGKDNVMHDKDFYTYAKGDNPICLLAHTDTLKQTTGELGYKDGNLRDISRPEDEPIKRNKSVLGADDRAGIFASLKTIEHCINNKIEKPSVVFTNLEEDIGLGMKVFLKDNHFDPSKTNLLLSIDRKGSNEYVHYTEELPDKVHKYMETHGFKKQEGVYSDGLELSLKTRIPNVNISIGYYNAHTSHEYLNMKDMNSNINRVMNMLEAPLKEKHLLKDSQMDTVFDPNEEYNNLLKRQSEKKKLKSIEKKFLHRMKST